MGIAKFEKVSFEQFKKDWIDAFHDSTIVPTDTTTIQHIYDSIKLPKRGTKWSAGYDMYSPLKFHLGPGQDIKIPTGIRCAMNHEYFLMIVPRSGLGFKYYSRLANTCGVIDADFFYADNEGHMFVKLRNESQDKSLHVEAGDAVCQGIFLKYGITDNDDASEVRRGGFGSTDKKDN